MHPDGNCGCTTTTAFNTKFPPMGSTTLSKYGVFESLNDLEEVLSCIISQSNELVAQSCSISQFPQLGSDPEGEEVPRQDVMSRIGTITRKARKAREILATAIDNNRSVL